MLVFHIDFNTVSLKRETVSSLLHFAAACGYDSILWEVEDKVRWDTCPECVHREAFSKDEFREILNEASALGLSPIPLMQTFGHAEYVLSHDEFSAWRELPCNLDCYCVSNPEVRAFQKKWLHEYLELFGDDITYFHLGGDEARDYGKCPECSARGRIELYAEHLKCVAEELLERGIRPCCWCDMILAGDDDSAISAIPREFVIWHWDYYYGCRNRPLSAWADKTPLLQKLGFDVVLCGAVQCGGESPFIPRYEWHAQNLAASARLVRDDGLQGFCVTSWSIRGSLKQEQLPLIEYAALCLRNPDADPDALLAGVVRSFFGDIRPEQLFDLSDWDHVHLDLIEGRSWNGYKDGAVPGKGRLPHVLKRHGQTIPEFPQSSIGIVDDLLARSERAAREIASAKSKTALTSLLLKGAELHAALLKRTLQVYRGGLADKAPFLDTANYYALEQTDWSACNFARIVWSVLDDAYASETDPPQVVIRTEGE